jgi:uncharacterized cupredoxin-like copper-binding protein
MIIGGLVLLVAILALTGVLPGGPGAHGPGRHLGVGANTTPATQNRGGVGGPADAAEATRTVRVSALDTMAFQPAGITVSKGEAVTFEVTNAGQAVHEFTLGDSAMQQEHAQAMAHIPEGITHAFPNSITLKPGETKRLTWRFGDAATLEFACHEPGHYQAGMRGEITVT